MPFQSTGGSAPIQVQSRAGRGACRFAGPWLSMTFRCPVDQEELAGLWLRAYGSKPEVSAKGPWPYGDGTFHAPLIQPVPLARLPGLT